MLRPFGLQAVGDANVCGRKRKGRSLLLLLATRWLRVSEK